jgi:hypothetical protein
MSRRTRGLRPEAPKPVPTFDEYLDRRSREPAPDGDLDRFVWGIYLDAILYTRRNGPSPEAERLAGGPLCPDSPAADLCQSYKAEPVASRPTRPAGRMTRPVAPCGSFFSFCRACAAASVPVVSH